jgi:hypothetical protein
MIRSFNPNTRKPKLKLRWPPRQSELREPEPAAAVTPKHLEAMKAFAARQQPVQELPAALPACETPPWE